MKYKNSLILNLALFYLIYLFFYGIIIKFTIFNELLFSLKTYVPEAILVLMVVLILLKYRVNFTYKTLLLAGYLGLIIVINYIFNGSTLSSLYWWRDLIIPFVTAMFVSNVKFTDEEISSFLKKLVFVCKWFLILGLGLAIIQQIKGDVWSSKFYTGYSFYEQDPYSKVKIAHNMGLLRAPSLTGNFSLFAYYSCFSLFIIFNNCKGKFNNFLWICIAITNCVLSTNKSAIIGLLAVLFIKYSYNIRQKNKTANLLFGALMFVSLVILMFLNIDLVSSATSVYTGGFFNRFGVWANILELIDPLELLIPYNMFLYGSGSGTGFGFFDNLYLCGLVTQGIIGFYLWFIYIKELYNANIKNNTKIKKLSKDMLYFMLFIGLTGNIIQGHAYFNIFLVIFAIFFDEKNLINKQNL